MSSPFDAPPHPIGTLVYGFGNPRKIGVVRSQTKVKLPRATVPGVEVEWPDGSREVDEPRMLTPIDDLIADHARKLEGHIERRARAAAQYGVNVPPVQRP